MSGEHDIRHYMLRGGQSACVHIAKSCCLRRPVILPDYAELDLKIPDDARCPAWVCFDGKQVCCRTIYFHHADTTPPVQFLVAVHVTCSDILVFFPQTTTMFFGRVLRYSQRMLQLKACSAFLNSTGFACSPAETRASQRGPCESTYVSEPSPDNQQGRPDNRLV